MISKPNKRDLMLILAGAGLFAIAVVVGLMVGKKRNRSEIQATGQLISRGQLLYQGMCASCHGPDGRGDGISARNMISQPRDFSLRTWKTNIDLDSIKKVVVQGIPGTLMPGVKNGLSEPDLDALANHVLKLADQTPPQIGKVFSKPEQIARDAGFVLLSRNNAPVLQLEDESGNKIKLSDFRGKTIMIHFWGVQCPHCLKEMKALMALEKSFQGKSFAMLNVCVDEQDAKSAQDTANKFAPGIKVLVESSGIGLAHYEVQALPAFWFIDGDGKTFARSTGAKDWASNECRKFIENLLSN